MSIVKRSLFAAMFIAIAHMGYSQVDNTMFFMNRLPQANLINPAQMPDCGIFIGGTIVPVLGQLPPSMTVAANLPLDFNDIIFKGKGEYKDSLISFMHPSYNKADFTKKLKNHNYFTSNFDLSILYFGFRQGKNYWTFDITTRVHSYINLPGDLVKFAIHGNANTRSADISGLSADAMVYNQIAVGFQRQLPLDFTMSARAKFLMGLANVSTGKTNLQLNTEEETNYITVMANYEIRSNLPLETTLNEKGNVDMDSTIKFKDSFGVKDFTGNYGGAIDLGISKKFGSQISVFASVIDLGFINWKKNANIFSLSGEGYTFEGAELSTDPFELSFPDFDSILNTYNITHKPETYRTWLPFKIYAGGHYQINKTFGVGLLGRLEKRPFGVSPSFTASVDVRPFKFGNAALTYSYMNRNFTNIGIGYTLRVGPVQWYFVSDNLIGTLLFPSNSRSMSVRFGCNLVFDRNSDGEKIEKPKKQKNQTKM
ncbi:MAG: DUF5723 family protein [Bacteroidales bacterium]|nr:DUF5723 family protein [Bacteroidales bacterium]